VTERERYAPNGSSVKLSCAVSALRSLPQMPESDVCTRTHSGPGSAGGATSSYDTQPSGPNAMPARPRDA
jgi:hypothetical protein